METKRRGRPRILELITLDQAVALIRAELKRRYKDDTVVEELSISKKTIYNKMSLQKIERHKKGRIVLVDKNEILEKLVS